MTRVAKESESHCSILVNNFSMESERFNLLNTKQINLLTNIKIEQYSFITKLLMGELREQSLRKYRSAVINVGTTKELVIV